MLHVPSLLFVCIHNAGRSQMAAGFARSLGGSAVWVASAGTAPADRVSGPAAESMAEVGIDITGQVPRLLTIEEAQAADVVVTMGCGAECPMFSGIDYRDWQLPVPAGPSVQDVRPVRDDIHTRVRTLLAELARDQRQSLPPRFPGSVRRTP